MLQDTQKKLNLAHDICVYAHKGQTDKAGQPYYLHPESVAAQVNEPNEKIVALLHDVLEDTDFPISVLEALFGGDVMEALKLLNHDKSVPYLDYVKELCKNNFARAVKIADLKHNMDLSRIPEPTEKDYARVEKYKKALKFLEDKKIDF